MAKTKLMATQLKNILIETEASEWLFRNPVKVTHEFDYNFPPIGTAEIKIVAGKLYADILLTDDQAVYINMYPHISFSRQEKCINSIKLSSIENADDNIKKIKDQVKNFA